MQKTGSFLMGLTILVVFLIWGNVSSKMGLSTLLTMTGYFILLIITTLSMTALTVYTQKNKNNEDKHRDSK
ncbi:hypothetical protein G7084_03745 [Weissella coleopterorum]|uniref:Uncharacterized protein n=1 Tax=Weissella coleopterorum TaxID=2714949 RepID=A0A6G8AZL3_9LACO|nr:hypothetical protein [Weissella coleopterorum]QIL50504.1 hypothetical protein G7084_03745 [Weissella coleopterorum]